MVSGYKDIIKNYFDKRSFIEDNLKSFDDFLAHELQKLIDGIGEITPTIVPPDVQEFKIKLDKIWVTKPQITEADGSKRDIYPVEARLRKLTYSAPIYLEVSAHVDGVQVENFTTLIGKIPIMVKSKFCHLNTLKREQLIEHGEDPDDCGGYFILNGNERTLVMVEDLGVRGETCCPRHSPLARQLIPVKKTLGWAFSPVSAEIVTKTSIDAI